MTIKLAERMSRIDSSGIRKVFNLAAKITDPINLSIGQPDFDVPDNVKAAAIRAIQKGANKYSLTQGTEELRAALREKLRARNGIEVPGDGIFVSAGVSGALNLIFMALFEEGDEILVADPYFVEYKHLGRLMGAKIIYVNTYPDLRLTAERIAPLITSRTKAIVINSPANPTGIVSTEGELRAIADLARRNDLLIISDEIYEDFCYEIPHFSVGSVYEKTLTLNGFSKCYGMTGWRIGYVAGPPEVITAITTLQQYTYVCAPTPFQSAAAMALKSSEGLEEKVAGYRRKRDLVVNRLKDHFEISPPGGAIYAFPKVPAGTATAFVARAIEEKGLLVIPGNVFSEYDTHFRLSFAASDETLERGCAALCELVDSPA